MSSFLRGMLLVFGLSWAWEIHAGIELKIWNFNVQGELDTTPPWSARQPAIGQFLLESGADIITLQELNWQEPEIWYGVAKVIADSRNEASPYQMWPEQPWDFQTKFQNAVLYKRKRFVALDRGVVYFPVEILPLYHWRHAAWVRLRDRETGGTFTVASTHFVPYGAAGTTFSTLQYLGFRQTAVDRLQTWLRSQASDHPILLAGDFNDILSAACMKPTAETINPEYDCVLEHLMNIPGRGMALIPIPTKGHQVDHVLQRNSDLSQLKQTFIQAQVGCQPGSPEKSCIKLSDHPAVESRVILNEPLPKVSLTLDARIIALNLIDDGVELSLDQAVVQDGCSTLSLRMPAHTSHATLSRLVQAFTKGLPLPKIAGLLDQEHCLFEISSL